MLQSRSGIVSSDPWLGVLAEAATAEVLSIGTLGRRPMRDVPGHKRASAPTSPSAAAIIASTRANDGMMKNPPARFSDAGSFVAGLVIGAAILTPVFATIVAEPGDWQALWILGALTLLALGFLLQAVVTARQKLPRHGGG